MPVGERRWLDEYFARYRRALAPEEVAGQLVQLKVWIAETAAAGRKLIVAGNGGSAAVASHCALDFTKQARIRCVCFSDASLITALANDYGYDRWLAEAMISYGDRGDLAILISSSGQSPNMVQAARAARENGLRLATLTGFAADNPLRAMGDMNLWVESRAYNVVEATHHIWLMAVCDLLIGSAEYTVRRGLP